VSAPVRVLIADDQRVVREGLEMILRFTPGVEVVGVAADGEEAVALAGRQRADVVLMDLRMPRLDGVEATKRLRETRPETRVIALTTYADESSVLAALQAGARGYLTKDSGAEALQRAIDDVMGGGAALDPAVQRHLVAAVAAAPAGAAEPEGPPLPDGLTPREAEVLTLIAEGLSNGEIAERLYVTQATVKSHVSHIFTKTRVRDRAQAVAYAYRHGLAEPG
jgi:DNA-binding NarL/FixJ family response regulator